MRDASITIRPMTAHTGAEILGVDLRDRLSDQAYLQIRAALNQWGAIFFRQQDITPGQQLSFARRFGDVTEDEYDSNLPSVAGHPEIKEIARKPEDSRNIGGSWHSDLSYLARPSYASILYAKKLPTHGGDTLFAHNGAAVDALSDGLRAMLETLSTVHVKTNAYGIGGQPQHGHSAEHYAKMQQRFAGTEAIHPVVVRLAESGRKVLYLNPLYSDRFVGWTREESLPLMQYLTSVMTRPELTCRFRWEDGSMAMWDNRAVLHYALDDYPGQYRLMHRITVQGPWREPV